MSGGKEIRRTLMGVCAGAVCLCVSLLSAGASFADISADIPSLRVSAEAEELRYERMMREAHDLTGQHWRADEVRNRIAELANDAAETSSSEFRNRWSIKQEDARVYRDELRRLISLYTAYMSVLQNPQEEPLLSRSEDNPLPAGPFSIAAYDELREEGARLQRRAEDSSLALRARASELSARITDYRKQQALLASLAKSINDQTFRYKREKVEAEASFVMLSISCVHMDTALSYNRAAKNRHEEMTQILRNTRGDIHFSEDELDTTLTKIRRSITAREADLEKTLDDIEEISEQIGRLLPHPENFTALGQDVSQRRIALYKNAGTSPERATLALEIARLSAENFRLYALTTEIDILSSMTTLWRTRYNILAGTATGDAFWNARQNAQLILDEIDKDEQLIYRNLEDIQSGYIIVENLMHDAKAETERALQHILDVFTEIQIHMHSKIEITIRAQRSLASGIIEESTEKIDSLRIAQRAAKAGRDFTHTYMNKVLWRGSDYEVTAYDMTLALVIFVIGTFASSLLSHLIIRVLSFRRKLDTTLLATVRRILFYLLFFSCFMLALDAINVPMTAFAFAGGTLALAVGFGAKDICGNQISGLMILFSRPFKHGDIINIDGTSGTVEEIGMRATRVYAFDGSEIMVPNSYFMENKIVNYTKSGPCARYHFRIRVAGDSDPHEIKAILDQTVKDCRNPVRMLEPFVVLSDFSARSLDFDIYYWLDIKKENPLCFSSNLRAEILQALRERNVNLYDMQEFNITALSKDQNIDIA